MLKKSRMAVWSSVAIVVVSVGAYLWLRPASVEAEARTILEAALRNDPDKIFSYSPPEERQSCGLTLESFRNVWATLIQPRMSEYKVNATIESAPYLEGHGATARVSATGPKLRTTKLAANAWQGDGGANTPVLKMFLLQAWILKYFADNDVPRNAAENFRARLEGLAKDREQLVKWGIKGLYSDPRVGFRSWEQLEKEWRQALVIAEAPQVAKKP